MLPAVLHCGKLSQDIQKSFFPAPALSDNEVPPPRNPQEYIPFRLSQI